MHGLHVLLEGNAISSLLSFGVGGANLEASLSLSILGAPTHVPGNHISPFQFYGNIYSRRTSKSWGNDQHVGLWAQQHPQQPLASQVAGTLSTTSPHRAHSIQGCEGIWHL